MARMITACAYLVNGEMLDAGVVSETKLAQLQAEGYVGRELVDALISDDWGAPPRFVKLSGSDSAGRHVDLTIHCD
jgi:hypothetical protein